MPTDLAGERERGEGLRPCGACGSLETRVYHSSKTQRHAPESTREAPVFEVLRRRYLECGMCGWRGRKDTPIPQEGRPHG